LISLVPAHRYRDSRRRSIVNVLSTKTSSVRTHRASVPGRRNSTSTHVPYNNVS
jgi:hypothetical protein